MRSPAGVPTTYHSEPHAMASISSRRAPNLFWRTFILLMLLIVFSVMGWLQSFRVLSETPYAMSAARQIVTMANLTRYALVSADPIYRPDLLMVLASREGLRILPKEPTDDYQPLTADSGSPWSIVDVETYVRSSLGPDTVLASRVNDERGLWVSISIEGDNYWLMTNSTLINPSYGTTWIWWAMAAFVASILGATMLTRRVVEPLSTLSNYARNFGRGVMPASLPEDSGPEEIREVNSSFNRMVQDITRMEKDREMLLAGVSHDLRTPITRLRLETEMADLPEDTRRNMVSDLEQMEMIVNQFMAYARRSTQPLEAVDLSKTVRQAIHGARLEIDPTVKLNLSIADDVIVRAHPIELSRVVQNLITNAQRYGKSDDDILHLTMQVTREKDTAVLTVSDEGPGLDMSQADRLMRPFERGDSARGGVTGTGLGLAIIDRIVRRSDGTVQLANASPHGLKVIVRIPTCEKKKEKKAAKDSAKAA